MIKAPMSRRDRVTRAEAMTLATVEAVVPALNVKSVCPRLWRGSPYTAPARGEEEGRGV